MKDIVLGLIRHAITSAGGVLITKGILTTAAFNEALGGLMIIVGTIWSAIEKLPKKSS